MLDLRLATLLFKKEDFCETQRSETRWQILQNFISMAVAKKGSFTNDDDVVVVMMKKLNRRYLFYSCSRCHWYAVFICGCVRRCCIGSRDETWPFQLSADVHLWAPSSVEIRKVKLFAPTVWHVLLSSEELGPSHKAKIWIVGVWELDAKTRMEERRGAWRKQPNE